MSAWPPDAARYRAAAVIASSAVHGSAIPSPFASSPQRIHVGGMNCIQPIAPAGLGPMLAPKFDSTLLIAASTCQGTPYASPARCQRAERSPYERLAGCAGGVERARGTTIVPAAFGST